MRTHGTHSCYAAGCRRPECRVAHAVYNQELRRGWRRSEPAAAFAEIIHFLTVPPLTLAELSDMTGVSVDTLKQVRDYRYATVNKVTADKLRASLPALLPSEVSA